MLRRGPGRTASPSESRMANSKPLMAQSSGTDHASAAVQSGLRTLDAEASGIAAISARLAGPARAGLHRRRRADPRRQGPRHRHRARQVRPCRAQDRGDAGLHRHAGLLRARRRSQPWRSRHDHVGRCHHRAVVVRRAAGDEEPRQLFQPLCDSDDRGDLRAPPPRSAPPRASCWSCRRRARPVRTIWRRPPRR